MTSFPSGRPQGYYRFGSPGFGSRHGTAGSRPGSRSRPARARGDPGNGTAIPTHRKVFKEKNQNNTIALNRCNLSSTT